MIRKIGRFDAYVPEYNPLTILLNILSYFAKGTRFQFSPVQIQKFFFDIKEKYPDLFNDINFTNDPSFPYSQELEEALTQLQDSGYVIRPNPTYFCYEVDADLKENMPDPLGESVDNQVISDIARNFQNNFSIQQ